MTSKIQYKIRKAVISDKIYFHKDDILDVTLQDLKYVLFNYNLGESFYSTLECNEESGICSVPSGSWHKLDILDLVDRRATTEAQAWSFKGSLRPEQQAVADKMLQKTKLYSGLIKADCGWGKCKPYFSKILTNKGLLSLEEIKTNWNNTTVVNNYGEFNINGFYDNGIEECFEVTTNIGNKIYGTAKHPILCWNKDTLALEFKSIKLLSNDDYIVGKFNTNIFGNNSVENPYLVGLLAGDGSLTLKNRIGFSSADKELQDYFIESFKNKKLNEVCYNNYKDMYVIDSDYYSTLKDLGLTCLSIEKKPSLLMRSLNRDCIIEILRGLYDTDGTVYHTGVIEYCSSSDDLAYFVFEQLLNLGILSTIKSKKTTHKDTNIIRIDSKFMCSKFKELIGFKLPRKQNLLISTLTRKTGSSTKGIFIGLNKIVYAEYKNNLLNKGLSKNFNNYFRNNISLEKFSQIIKIFKQHKLSYNPLLEELTDCYATKVFKIRSIGKVQTYDIQVNHESHSYISEGVINHNTFLGTYLIGNYKKPTLIICHTKLLAYQWLEALQNLLEGVEIGFIGDGKESIKPITVAIYKSLLTRLDKVHDKFEVIFVDEAHLCPAETFSQAVNGVNARVKIALSATPTRKDGLHVILPDYFGPNRIIAESVDKLSAKVQIVSTKTAFNVINPNRDWTRQLTKLSKNKPYLNLIAQIATDKIAYGRCPLILSERIEMLEELQTLIPKSVLLVGSTKNTEREDILKNAGTKYSSILSTRIFDEGISCHRLDTLLFTCPGNNYAKLEQRIGRILRNHPDKQYPLIIDFWLSGAIVYRQQQSRLEWYRKQNYEILDN